MISENIAHRIQSLNPKARKLFLMKLKEAFAQKKVKNATKKQIVAYIMATEDLSVANLKTELKKNLPDYMVPSKFIRVAQIPLLPNGKINRDKIVALKTKDALIKPVKSEVKNDVSQRLLQIWEEVLGFSPIHKDDNFFEIGGDSILSIQIIAKAKKAGLVLNANDLFKHQTISELAKTVAVENTAKVASEDILLQIWEEVLGFSPIHKNDNFFEIGGDSILSIQIIAKAKKAGLVLNANDLFKYQTISELAKTVTVENTVKVSSEEILLQIWEEVLGFSPIHKDDNFFEIGGDSILSIQIIAKAKKAGLVLKANDLFKYQTISELAKIVSTKKIENKSEILAGKVALTPIQQWFFNDHKNEPNYWNQGVKLENLPKLSEKQIASICTYLITQHDVLRASYNLIDDSWVQEIISSTTVNTLKYIDVSLLNDTEIADEIVKQKKEIQQNFNLSKGGLFQCIYFSNANSKKDFCLIIAHHLVVDAVSWQIIIDDFTSAIADVANGIAINSMSKTNSFKDWSNYLKSYTDQISNDEFNFWKNQILPVKALPIDKENSAIIEEKDTSKIDFSLDTEITNNLVKANKAFNTKTDELLIAAFIKALGNWSGNTAITLGFERHGRETKNTPLDLSKTVGWFTAYFPLKFSYKQDITIDNLIIATKEKVRSVPNGGIGFGGLRYLKNAFGTAENPEIVFNFLGTQNTNANAIKATTITENLRAPKSERKYKIEINLSITNNALEGAIIFGNTVHKEQTITALKEDFVNQLKAIVNHCNEADKGKYTPSDFSDVDISQDDLDNLIDFLD